MVKCSQSGMFKRGLLQLLPVVGVTVGYTWKCQDRASVLERIRKGHILKSCLRYSRLISPYPTAFPYGNGMVLHFYQQQESSTTKTVHKVINKGLKTYV